jgi:cytochrome P450
LGFLEQCAREYGDVVKLKVATVPVYLLNHPDYIEYVLVTNQRNFVKSRTSPAATSVFGNGLFNSSGDFWLHQRRLMQPAFHRAQLLVYGDAIVAQTLRMLDTWHDRRILDVYKEMMDLSLAIVAKTLFGTGTGRDAAQIEASVNTITKRFRLEFPFPTNLFLLLPSWAPTPANLRLKWAVRKLDQIIYRIIEERSDTPQTNDDLLSILLRARKESNDGMTDQQLYDEVITLLLTGHETSACALSWTWYLLSQHPEVEAKLKAELLSHLQERLPTIADLHYLPYAQKVIKESLRLYPPAWGMNRIALKDCEIGGYAVPAGAAVAMSQWVMHRDSRYFENPTVFNPDRWTEEMEKGLPRYAYFPFGGGPRLCVGRDFTMLELVLVVATVAQRYQFRLVPEHRVQREVSITLRPKGGIWVTADSQNPKSSWMASGIERTKPFSFSSEGTRGAKALVISRAMLQNKMKLYGLRGHQRAKVPLSGLSVR